MNLNENAKDTLIIGATTVAGGAAGAGLTATIGGIGVAAVGTAVALPVAAIGAGLGAIIGGVFVLGKRLAGKK